MVVRHRAGQGGAPAGCARTLDNTAGSLELVTLGRDCRRSHGDASLSVLAPDGHFVVFESDADDLSPNDVNGADDVFLFDRTLRSLERISVGPGAQAANSYSFTPVGSDDGRYVVFTSMATNLVSTPTSGAISIYVRDRDAAQTSWIPSEFVCGTGPRASGDGNLIVWESLPSCNGTLDAADRIRAFTYDRRSSASTSLNASDGSDAYGPAISRDGRWIAWGTRPPGTRGQWTSQLQLLDRQSGVTATVPVGSAYNFASIALSDNADVVAYGSNGDIYRYDRVANDLRCVSNKLQGARSNGTGFEVALSGDGRFVVFSHAGSDLVEQDTNGVSDIFLFDSQSGLLRRVNVAPDGTQADDQSNHPAISADGRWVAFASKARNLLPAATSGDWQLSVATVGP
jgi:Tol biopolymer transport system component